MSYTGTHCALCGVDFDIGRMRTEHEPPSAAWSIRLNDGPPDGSNCLQLGCKTLRRERESSSDDGDSSNDDGDSSDLATTEKMWDVIPSGHDSQGNEVSLTSFLKLTQAEDYVGRAEEQIRHVDTNQHGLTPREAFERERTHRLLDEYLAWYESRVPKNEQKPTRRNRGDIDFFFYHELFYDEHIAGPNCIAKTCAYSGFQASYEEMKSCVTVQCLGPKTSEFMISESWAALPDDEEFERTTEYCLSGLGDHPGSTEEFGGYPARHGVDDLYPSNFESFDAGNLPFHPYCFEIYKRASLLHTGETDIDVLAKRFDGGDLEYLPQHPAVLRGRQHSWVHHHGDEFLVVNPVHIPALRKIIERARRTEPDFSTSNYAFQVDVATPERERDVFGRLPEELRDMILNPLGSKDIANLRLASSSFRKLPISLWYRLIKEEMPWLWEAWCDRPYSFWACTTMKELETHDEAWDARLQALNDLPDKQKAAQKRAIAQERLEARKPKPAQQLDRQRTDWHWLYREIKRERKNIKGLQNRERIWYAQAHIVTGSAESRALLNKRHADYTARHGKVRDD